MLLYYPGKPQPISALRPRLIPSEASSPQPPIRLQLLKSSHPRNCLSVQHWRCCLPHRLSSKHHRPPKHAPSTQLGRLVLHRPPYLRHLYPSHLDPPPHHIPARQRHHHRPDSPHERQVHRRTILHQRHHHRHHSPMVRHTSISACLWRHGRRSHHSHGRLLWHWYPYERRLQQFPLDHHHPRRGWPVPRQSRLLIRATAHHRRDHHRESRRPEPLRRPSRLRRPDPRHRDFHLPYRRGANHPTTRASSGRRNGRPTP